MVNAPPPALPYRVSKMERPKNGPNKMKWPINGPNEMKWPKLAKDEMKWSKMVQNKGEITNWNMQGKIYKSQMFELGQISLLGGKENLTSLLKPIYRVFIPDCVIWKTISSHPTNQSLSAINQIKR